MGWGSTKEFVESNLLDGSVSTFSWRKTPAVATTQGIWFDLSMSPGTPAPNYYASSPRIPAVFNSSRGIFHGGSVAPGTKHLKEMLVVSAGATGLPATFILCDYLAYYPFIDQGVLDEQTMDNNFNDIAFELPRYPTGEGVRIMPVLVAPQSGSVNTRFNVTYTDEREITQTITDVFCNTATSNGTILSSSTNINGAPGPFLPTVGNVTKIESVTMLATDIGLMSLALVKPLATFTLLQQTAPVEVCYFRNTPSLPRIRDGAYLNLIVCPAGNLSGTALHGLMTTCWSKS